MEGTVQQGTVQIDEAGLERLIPHFYARVRADDQLGPVFNDIVDDWPDHLEKLVAFWSSVMLTSGRYKGNPVMAHARHHSRMTPELFTRWLELWAQVTDRAVLSTAPGGWCGPRTRLIGASRTAAARPASPSRTCGR